jgi:hypothetical protein
MAAILKLTSKRRRRDPADNADNPNPPLFSTGWVPRDVPVRLTTLTDPGPTSPLEIWAAAMREGVVPAPAAPPAPVVTVAAPPVAPSSAVAAPDATPAPGGEGGGDTAPVAAVLEAGGPDSGGGGDGDGDVHMAGVPADAPVPVELTTAAPAAVSDTPAAGDAAMGGSDAAPAAAAPPGSSDVAAAAGAGVAAPAVPAPVNPPAAPVLPHPDAVAADWLRQELPDVAHQPYYDSVAHKLARNLKRIDGFLITI